MTIELIVTIAGFILGGAVVWGKTLGRMKRNEEKILELKEDCKENREACQAQTCKKIDDIKSAVETGTKEIHEALNTNNERFITIADAIGEIKGILKAKVG